jgi:DNA-directed RNA polymerase specialized sigma24 family protein
LIRRRGHGRYDAQDLTQDFFVHLLEKGILGQVDPRRGRFRNFLLGSLEHFLAHAAERAGARELESEGKGNLFEALKGSLLGQDDSSYQQVANTLNLSLGALKTAIHRLRSRYRALLREEVARTVTTPAEVDEELRYLRAALNG